ncbi:hypothetical protein KDV83_18575, partial [Citrobacter sedlakii]
GRRGRPAGRQARPRPDRQTAKGECTTQWRFSLPGAWVAREAAASLPCAFTGAESSEEHCPYGERNLLPV